MLWVPTPIRKAAFGTRYGQTGARQTPGHPLFTWKSKLSRETRLAMGSMGPASAGCRAPHLNFSIPSARLHEQSTAAPPSPFPQRRPRVPGPFPPWPRASGPVPVFPPPRFERRPRAGPRRRRWRQWRGRGVPWGAAGPGLRRWGCSWQGGRLAPVLTLFLCFFFVVNLQRQMAPCEQLGLELVQGQSGRHSWQHGPAPGEIKTFSAALHVVRWSAYFTFIPFFFFFFVITGPFLHVYGHHAASEAVVGMLQLGTPSCVPPIPMPSACSTTLFNASVTGMAAQNTAWSTDAARSHTECRTPSQSPDPCYTASWQGLSW